jgi:glycerophosphoryl diester phosphodiesterase
MAGASALLLGGCSADQPPPPKEDHQTAAPPIKGNWTISDLLKSDLFYVAHRGSADNWVEQSWDAYANSIRAGARAIEVSVNATADGVLVCHHDPTTRRLSKESVTISRTTWAELSTIPNDAREWLGPSVEPKPIPRLSDVLDAFAETHVIFIEDKQGTNTGAVLDLMDTYKHATSHFVWKQWAGSRQYDRPLARGYKRWGYFTTDIMYRIKELQARFDYLGVPTTASDNQVEALVDFGKPVIGWEVHTRSVRDRLSKLGVQGMMCSNIPYLTKNVRAAADTFGSGIRAAGDLPWTTSKGWSYQPSFDLITSALTIGKAGIQSYVMGSMAPIEKDTYELSFELRWPDGLPAEADHVGIAFGQPDDSAYRVRVPSEVAGYHVIFRANGVLELFARQANSVEGTRLEAAPTTAAVPGQWMKFTVRVSPDRISVGREGLDIWDFEVRDSKYRGGYFSLCKNYDEGPPVQFRSITVS